MPTIRGRIISGLSWQGASVALQALTQLAVLAILARYIAPEAFGIVAAANIVIAFVQMLSEAGVAPALVQSKRIHNDQIGMALLSSASLGLLFCLITWLLATPIETFFDIDQLGDVIRVLSISCVFIGIFKVPESLLLREFRFKTLLKINVVTSIVGYSLPAISLAVAGYGVWAMVIASLSQLAAKAIIMYAVRPVSLRINMRMGETGKLFHFGAGFTLVRFFSYIIIQADRFVTGKFLGSVGLGYYHVAAQLATMPVTYVADIFDNVLFSTMSSIQGDKIRLRKIYSVALTAGMLPMGLLGVFMAMNGEELVRVIFGERWLVAADSFAILSIGGAFRMGIRVSDVLNRSVGAVYQAATMKMLLAALVIIACLLGQYRGIEGVASGILASHIIGFFLTAQLSAKILGTRFIELFQMIAIVLASMTVLAITNYLTANYLLEGVGNNAMRILGCAFVDALILMLAVLFFRSPIMGYLKPLLRASS